MRSPRRGRNRLSSTDWVWNADVPGPLIVAARSTWGRPKAETAGSAETAAAPRVRAHAVANRATGRITVLRSSGTGLGAAFVQGPCRPVEAVGTQAESDFGRRAIGWKAAIVPAR